MNEIIQNLEVNATNGYENFCYISENKLNALKELSKREKRELQKYKSLYENEKDKNDTLVRIVKKIEEKIKKHLSFRDYSYHKYELFGREYLEDILDLLKEIK